MYIHELRVSLYVDVVPGGVMMLIMCCHLYRRLSVMLGALAYTCSAAELLGMELVNLECVAA